MNPDKPKQLNINTMLLTLANLLVLITGFFAKHTLERIETNQTKLWEAIVPRHEIELQLQSLRTDNIRIVGDQQRLASDQQEFRARLSKLEIDYARMQKP